VNIRPAIFADISAILSLERQSATAARWTEQQYHQIFQAPEQSHSQRLVLVAEEKAGEKTSLLGLLVAHHVPPEWELENVVVAPTSRRKGLATLLLRRLINHARETHSESIFLEVRESNAAARGLYEKHSFEKTGARKAYYATPAEDAVLYRRDLTRIP